MPSLELLIDASGMQRGAQQATTALKQVQVETAATDRVVTVASKQIGTGMVQASSSIVDAAQSFNSFNTSAGLFSSSRALLDIGNVTRDFRALSVAGSGVRGVIAGIGTAVKANPLGALAAVLSTVAIGMGLFGGETEKAKTKFEELSDAIAKARMDAATAQFLGISTIRARQAGQQAVEQKLDGITGGASVDSAAHSLGLTRMDVVRYLSQQQGGDASAALEYIRTGRVTPYESVRVGSRDYPNVPRDVQSLVLNNEQLRGLFRQVYKFNQNQIEQDLLYGRNAKNLGPLGDAGAYDQQVANDLYGDQTSGAGVRMSTEQRRQLQQENVDRANAAMDELVRKGEQFGASIGDAFFNVASGAQTARQAIAGIISDLARAASQRAFASIFGSAFGATAAQAKPTIDPAGS